MPKGLPDPAEMGRYVALAQVGTEMVVPIVLGLVLDHYLGWRPWGVVVGAVVGFVGGLAHLFALLRRFEQQEQSRPPEQHEEE